MNSWVIYGDGNRVPSRYPKAAQWYSDNDREWAADTAGFLDNLRSAVWGAGHKSGYTMDIRGQRLDGIKWASKADESNMTSQRESERNSLFGLNPDTTNYVPIIFTEGGENPIIRNAYLIRHKRSGGDDTVFGMELDDGRTFTAEGAKEFLDNLYKKGGGASIGLRDFKDANKVQYTQHIRNADDGMQARHKGFIEALRSTRRGDTAEALNSTGEVGAFPSNWWGQ